MTLLVAAFFFFRTMHGLTRKVPLKKKRPHREGRRDTPPSSIQVCKGHRWKASTASRISAHRSTPSRMTIQKNEKEDAPAPPSLRARSGYSSTFCSISFSGGAQTGFISTIIVITKTRRDQQHQALEAVCAECYASALPDATPLPVESQACMRSAHPYQKKRVSGVRGCVRGR